MSTQQPPPWTMSAPPPGARDVVTGEAVALELRLAKLPSRALGKLADLAVVAVPLTLLGLLAAVTAAGTDPALGAAVMLTCVVAVVIGYPVLFETLSRGRTPGKMLLGLRVVRDDGGPIRFRHALVRALVGVFVDFNPLAAGAVGVLVSLGSAKGKRVGDMLAGTVVVRERVPASYAAPAAMPPHLAGWAAGLPVMRVPDPLALQARQVLGRLGQLDPEVGHALTHQLAGEVLAALAAAPPTGSDPVAVLSAVLAERRGRELARAGVPAFPGGAQPTNGAPPGWGTGPPPGWGAAPPAPPDRGAAQPGNGWAGRQAGPAGWPAPPAAPQPPASPVSPAPPPPEAEPPAAGPFTAPS